MSTLQNAQAHDGGDSPAVVGPPVLFTVTKGSPTAEELAALTAVIAAASSADAVEAPAALTRRERIRQATLRPRHMIAQRRGRL
ncbi:acyl-CoA carboxylase epsilon subunit [Sinomonas atrocyanea]|uniref:acyl-CoA carboxylase epsilon subunit n=1 Tax=Sinomonas atrocyanea TaxID=37927 RepID=UPI003D95523E